MLVFGFLPQFPHPSKREQYAQTARYKAVATARDTYEKIVGKERIRMVAKTRITPASKVDFQPGDYAYVYRENTRQHSGPHLIASTHAKQARLHVGEETGSRSFNIAQLRKAPISCSSSVSPIPEPTLRISIRRS